MNTRTVRIVGATVGVLSLVAATTTSSGPALAVTYQPSSAIAIFSVEVSGGPVYLQGVGASCDSAPASQPAQLSAPLTVTVTVPNLPESYDGSNELSVYIGDYFAEHWYEAVSGVKQGTYTFTIPVTGGGGPYNPSQTLTCGDAQSKPDANAEILAVKANLADWNAYVNRGYTETTYALTNVD